MDILAKNKTAFGSVEDRLSWKECDYFKALYEIYNKVMKMEEEGTHKTRKEDYNKLLDDYQDLNEEYKKFEKIEKWAKKKIKKLLKKQEEKPMNSFLFLKIEPF